MEKELTSQTKFTNRYLKDIEQWREREVNGYNRKVGFELSEAWTGAVIVFALMFTVLGYAWAFIATALPDSVGATLKACIGVGVYLIFTALVAVFMSKKNLKKFVEVNRGEVGHRGEPYYKKIVIMIPVSLLIGVAVNVCLWFFAVKDVNNFTTDTMGTLQPIICAILYPFFYYLSTLVCLSGLQKRTCPVCRRFDSVVTKNTARYGKKREGMEHVTKTQTKKVGEKQTIARYSDGSTRVVSSEPIYANVVVDEYDVEYGTVMSDYITYCRHCSYIKQGTREQSYKTRVN